jgi:uncharacterized membrane protein
MEQGLMEAIRWITRGIEIIGVTVILVGAVVALFAYVRQLGSRRPRDERISDLRSDLGRSILLGLEFLVAADIVNTVAIHPTLESLGILAGIVLIRTFLSFALEVEIEGRWPWQGRAGTAREAPGGG